eukprot:981668-Pyramimonas_sp.AAC.1
MERARAVVEAGGTVCIEWPSQCQYWRDPQGKASAREIGLHKSVLHVCAYGLRDRKRDLMEKPWAIASTSALVAT